MKKALSLMIAAVLLLTFLVGCADKQQSSNADSAVTENTEIGEAAEAQEEASQIEVADDGLKIGLSMRETKNPFLKVISDTIVADGEAKGIEVVALDAQNDLAKQASDIENLISMDIDVLIVDLIEPNGFDAQLQNARDAGIKTLTVNDSVGPETPIDASVLTSTWDSCYGVGQWAAEQMGDTPIKALVMSGQIGNLVGLDRRSGIIQGIQEYQLAKYGKTDFQVVHQFYFDGWNSEAAVDKFEAVAPTLDFNMIITESDVATLYCWDSIVKYGLEDVMIVCGADGSKECVKMVMDGNFDVTTMNSPSALGHMAFTTAVKLYNGEQVPEVVETEITLVIQENAAEFYNPDSLF